MLISSSIQAEISMFIFWHILCFPVKMYGILIATKVFLNHPSLCLNIYAEQFPPARRFV